LADQAGHTLYAFQLVDAGYETLEGAWRRVDIARRSGFILAAREGGRTSLRFFEPGGSGPILVTLEPALDGSWRGQMVREGTSTPVVMRRQ